MKPYKIIIICLCFTLLVTQQACKKYLDQKPDMAMVVPSTLADCQVLLDNFIIMNSNYPDHGEAAADNYYLTDATWNGLPSTRQEDKDCYVWVEQGMHTLQWSNAYKTVYTSNLVLQVLEKFPPTSPNYDVLKGTALFFRAFSFYQVAQLFCKPYNVSTVHTDLGIPTRLSPDLEIKSDRGTVQQTYDQIIKDLKDAVNLLPIATASPSRPSKTAAYAALARTYLAMEDYDNAGLMAGECLKLQNTLIDYNSTTSTPTPTTVRTANTGGSFFRFNVVANAEVIFMSISYPGVLTQSQAKIDKDLYDSYSIQDRRKSVFFQANTGANAGTFAFRGNYDGSTNAALFNGFATDEIYLIRAECFARNGNKDLALADLNTLMKKRISPPYTDITATDAEDALQKILQERRKELIFRTLRWTDLRRLNKDNRFAKRLTRPKNTMTYVPLEPDDLRYTMLIPLQVINTTNMRQNPR